jgi:hypothetical protein
LTASEAHGHCYLVRTLNKDSGHSPAGSMAPHGRIFSDQFSVPDMGSARDSGSDICYSLDGENC